MKNPTSETTKKRPSRTDYETEKIEAYNVAIEALRAHEPADDTNADLAFRLRKKLADRLDREIQRWCDQRGLSQ